MTAVTLPEIDVTAPPGGTTSGGGVKAYVQNPGQTQDQTTSTQERYTKAFKDQLDRVTVELPGDVNIDPVGQLNLSGTQSAADGTYSIKSVVWRYSAEEGFRMTITAQNPPVSDELGAD
jgi:hypothetical protein